MRKISRRDFLRIAALTGSGVLVGEAAWQYRKFATSNALAPSVEPTSFTYLPTLSNGVAWPTRTPTSTSTHTPTPTPTDTSTPTNTPTPTSTHTPTPTPTDTPTPTATNTPPPVNAKVVHMRSLTATNWDFGGEWYGWYVSQERVNAMTDQGLMELTGTASRAAAWNALLPNFQAGQRIAIKVNFNNGGAYTMIDALIEPVNALILGLLERGFAASDIYVYDVTHAWHAGTMPAARFIDRCIVSGVNFVYYVGNPNPFSSTQFVHFSPPAGGPPLDDQPLANALVNADYLINMPILKVHPFSGVTLGFKNHFGSFEYCQYAHEYLPACLSGPCSYYDPNYSPLIDIFASPHISGKTVLTVGDCLFGAWCYEACWQHPEPWQTFGNAASNSLFFARDPVAIECVMTDILAAEEPLPADPNDFLVLAGQAGFGVYERGDPWGAGYQYIDYVRTQIP